MEHPVYVRAFSPAFFSDRSAFQVLSRVSEAADPLPACSGREVMLLNLANCHTMVGHFGQAIKLYQTLLRTHPGMGSRHALFALQGQVNSQGHTGVGLVNLLVLW